MAQTSKNVIFRLPLTKWGVYNLTPRNDCKQCGFRSCISFAEAVEADKSIINQCPYIDETIYWLEARNNCNECSYPPCAEFVKKIAEGAVAPDNCPYTVENIKQTKNSAANQTQSAKPLMESFDQNMSVLEEGRVFAAELDKANKLISDEKLSGDLDIIKAQVLDIFEFASKESSVQSQIRKFNNIYLPMTLKMLNVYIEMDSRKTQSQSVIDTKAEIASSIENAKNAFAKLNNDLFEQTSIDTSAEIEAFKNLLEIDGLTGNHQMKMPPKTEE